MQMVNARHDTSNAIEPITANRTINNVEEVKELVEEG